jgi:hypothetical protein
VSVVEGVVVAGVVVGDVVVDGVVVEGVVIIVVIGVVVIVVGVVVIVVIRGRAGDLVVISVVARTAHDEDHRDDHRQNRQPFHLRPSPKSCPFPNSVLKVN